MGTSFWPSHQASRITLLPPCIHQLAFAYLYYFRTVKVVQGVKIYKGNKTSGSKCCGDEKGVNKGTL